MGLKIGEDIPIRMILPNLARDAGMPPLPIILVSSMHVARAGLDEGRV